ncbi:TPA: alpha amylase C-terminal domain-containing protein, partial [Klebsiella pneumoniae]|nr:alpha amylase C-terminal domain-containing protein [Klebsiella pneumoniae]
NLRKDSPAIQNGTYNELWVNDDILVFERRSGDDIVIVALNRGPENTINVSNLSIPDGMYQSLIGNNSISVNNKQAAINLMQNEYLVIRATAPSEGESKSISFVCENGYTTLGQSVYIVGNTPLLGNWNLTNAIKMSPTQYPQWKATLQMAPDLNVEWKCVKRDEVNPSANIQWQSGGNNQFNSSLNSNTVGSF